MIEFTRNHFELFGLPVRFRVDADALDRAYLGLQAEVHPDRFATGTDAERRLALQASARVNEAYRTLQDPVRRATYLLSLHGVNAHDETDTRLPMEFLETQLERREAASDAVDREDLRSLDALLAEIRGEIRDREALLGELLDGSRDWREARGPVRELTFLNKVAEDVDAMAAALDA